MIARKFVFAAALTGLTLGLQPAAVEALRPAPAEEAIEGRERSRGPDRAAGAKEPRARKGSKTWKERINTVARQPLHHDLETIDATDRVGWEHGEGPWRGVRDFRPMIARTTHGFGPKKVRKTRFERVMTVSRGPIVGPGFSPYTE